MSIKTVVIGLIITFSVGFIIAWGIRGFQYRSQRDAISTLSHDLEQARSAERVALGQVETLRAGIKAARIRSEQLQNRISQLESTIASLRSGISDAQGAVTEMQRLVDENLRILRQVKKGN